MAAVDALSLDRLALGIRPDAGALCACTATAGDPQLLRGAYLVQGLGHCGACHTARGVGMQEKALTELDSSACLAGGAAIDGWVAPSLRNEHGGGLARWSEARYRRVPENRPQQP